ncbi:hypothetical protein [Streptomyces sp.]|uniref:hypothetical protein n=1 Tax=Streptomyces sp. TaxID=1931 RepID=UPI002F952EF4
MPEYRVYATWDVEWVIDAESADAAEQVIDDGEAPAYEVTGYSVEKVVAEGKGRDADDEREACVCGHLVRNHWGLWSGKAGDRPKPHPRACDAYQCDCLSPISTVPDAPADTGEGEKP